MWSLSVLSPYFQTAVTSKRMIGKGPGWSHSLCLIKFFWDLTNSAVTIFVRASRFFLHTIVMWCVGKVGWWRLKQNRFEKLFVLVLNARDILSVLWLIMYIKGLDYQILSEMDWKKNLWGQTRAMAIEFVSFLVKADVVNLYLPLSSIESKSKWWNLGRAWKDEENEPNLSFLAPTV
jgi:hypothetical protein